MFVCLFWAATLAMDVAGQRDRAKVILMLFMLVTAVLYFGHHVYFMHNTGLLLWADTAYAGVNLAVYPLYLIYILELTSLSGRRFWHLAWLLPAVVASCVVGALYMNMTAAEAHAFVSAYLYHNDSSALSGLPRVQAIVHNICRVVFALEVVPVLFIGSRQIRYFDFRVLNNYADVDDKVLYRMHTLLMFFVLTSAVSFASNAVGRHYFDHSPWLLAIPSITFSTLLFILGYVGHVQKFSIDNLEKDLHEEPVVMPQPTKEAKPRATKVQKAEPLTPVADVTPVADTTEEVYARDLRQRLDDVMIGRQLYLRSNLRLTDLVKEMHSNRNYVYNIINRDMGISFSEYVNRLRAQHAARLLDEGYALSHNELAEKSGFSSTTSFYRNFKLYMGCSPKEYQNKLKRRQ